MTEVLSPWFRSYTSFPPGVVPTNRWYPRLPTPGVQVKMTLVPVKVLVGAGLVRVALLAVAAV